MHQQGSISREVVPDGLFVWRQGATGAGSVRTNLLDSQKRAFTSREASDASSALELRTYTCTLAVHEYSFCRFCNPIIGPQQRRNLSS
jgi:hypothetical protein